MLRVLILLFGLAGCGLFARDPVAVPFVPGCAQYAALARAVVEGRRQGQSRTEQRQLLARLEPGAALHASMVDSVYDWPRPVTPAGWSALSDQAGLAAFLRCQNRPAAVFGGWVPP